MEAMTREPERRDQDVVRVGAVAATAARKRDLAPA